MTDPLSVQLMHDHVLVDDNLRISFRRTVRVPDNKQVSKPPPNLGNFPLKPVSRYAHKMPFEMTLKGGFFFPMYQSEAMWIDFLCGKTRKYMIKIYVGGVNAISGEPANEGMATTLRRRAKMAAAHDSDYSGLSSLQDYVIVPGQKWLDGIAESSGKVRQFVAMPFGSDYSVESQVTGKDTAGGIQFEITSCKLPPPRAYTAPPPPAPYKGGEIEIFIKTLEAKTICCHIEPNATIDDVKNFIHHSQGISPSEQRLTFAGELLESGRCLADYGIGDESTLHIALRLLGGGLLKPDMSISAGGRIEQFIVPDDTFGTEWLPGRTTVFNAQIVNSVIYKIIITRDPPEQPMTAKNYASHGFPFFKLYEEHSNVHGNFSAVKSVAQIDKSHDSEIRPNTVAINRDIGLTNPDGPLLPFRTLVDLKKQMKSAHSASF